MRHGELLALLDTRVAPDWVDYNGHMNDAAYALVFSRACDALMDKVHLDAGARKATAHTLYTLQMMLHYFREAKEGEPLSVSAHLLQHDDKRMRVWFAMRRGEGGPDLAASEQLLLSVHLAETPRAANWLPETLSALDALAKAQGGLPAPALAGQGIALKRK